MAQTTFANPETLVNELAEVRAISKELKEKDKKIVEQLHAWATQNSEFFKDGKLDFAKGSVHFNSKPRLQVPANIKDNLLDLAALSPALVKVSLNESAVITLFDTGINPALINTLVEEGFKIIPDGKENFRINTK